MIEAKIKDDCLHWRDSNGKPMKTILFENLPPVDVPVEDNEQLEFTIDGKPF